MRRRGRRRRAAQASRTRRGRRAQRQRRRRPATTFDAPVAASSVVEADARRDALARQELDAEAFPCAVALEIHHARRAAAAAASTRAHPGRRAAPTSASDGGASTIASGAAVSARTAGPRRLGRMRQRDERAARDREGPSAETCGRRAAARHGRRRDGSRTGAVRFAVRRNAQRAVRAMARSACRPSRVVNFAAHSRQRVNGLQLPLVERNRPSRAAALAGLAASVRRMKAETLRSQDCSIIVTPITGLSVPRVRPMRVSQ